MFSSTDNTLSDLSGHSSGTSDLDLASISAISLDIQSEQEHDVSIIIHPHELERLPTLLSEVRTLKSHST